ncbi:hypothetical protein IAT38_001056 [Cryptococcus sp. DSM 104549]
MRIAIQGCSHGSLTAIYDTVLAHNARSPKPVDLLLLCGDFQALRSAHDFDSLAVPQKFRSLGTFHDFYAGRLKAPVLTIVIGGNHEASNYMWELYHGGWLAPNIYYLGAAGSVLVDGIRIAGASGIYKQFDYTKGHHEKVPFNNSTLRSVYHIREYDVMKLMQLPPAPNTLFMSHDWPISIARHGDTRGLLKRKPFFEEEIKTNTLGSPPLLTLLNHLQPSYWFAAHLHVKFAALYEHKVASHAPDVGEGEGKVMENGRGAGGEDEEYDMERELEAALAGAEIEPEAAPTTVESKADPAAAPVSAAPTVPAANPDEIALDLDDELDLGLSGPLAQETNPDEIVLDDEEFDDEEPPADALSTTEAGPSKPAPFVPAGVHAVNPEEIAISDDEFDDPAAPVPAPAPATAADDNDIDESVDLVEQARRSGGHAAGEIAAPEEDVKQAMETVHAEEEERRRAQEMARATAEFVVAGGLGEPGMTKFLALDKCGPGKDHMQFLEIPAPLPSSTPGRPRITFDPQWLAITRALHPWLSTTYEQKQLPSREAIEQLVADEVARIESDGLLVPELHGPVGEGGQPVEVVEGDGEEAQGPAPLVWETGLIDIDRVQKFWPTAPPTRGPGHQAEGSPGAWYTNPQTEAFCGMLGLKNMVNPAPSAR